MTLLARVQDVAFAYGSERGVRVPAIEGVTFEVQTGDRVGLLGASGSGKSTLLHLLAGLLKPQHGSIDWQMTGDRSPTSLVFQFPERQLFAETVHEDVGYGLRESGIAAPEVERRVVQALETAGLPSAEFAPRPPFHLSGGEMRRVALAGAFAQERPVVLLDEPTLGLDADGRARLEAALRAAQSRGAAVWLASHDADFVQLTCDRVVVLDAGRVAFAGPTQAVWSNAEQTKRWGLRQPRAWELVNVLRTRGVDLEAMDLRGDSTAAFATELSRLRSRGPA